MKTTVEVSDDLYRRIKSEAALRGRKLKDLVEEGWRLVLETPREARGDRAVVGAREAARENRRSDPIRQFEAIRICYSKSHS